jgi:MoaA/NifB/PqqE/SkfB family radical SAM enzyme
MYLYETIDAEMAAYPLDYFVERFKVSYVSLEITKHCTNKCRHCTNYASLRNREYMDFALIKKIVDQAAEFGHSLLHIWGGEPFLHKDFYAILAYCLQKGISPCVNTNAFWAVSEQAVREVLAKFKALNTSRAQIKIEVSCDGFHQEQKATPAQKIVNALAAFEKAEYAYWRMYTVKTQNDATFEQVLALLAAQNPGLDLDKIREKQRCLPLEAAAGRAKTIIDPDTRPYEYFYMPRAEIIFCVSVAGEVFLYETFVGDKIFPLGSVAQESIADVLENLNKQRLLKLLHFQPLKFFFYPFRKYVDIQKTVAEIADGKTENFFFIRNFSSELLQIKKAQFDKSKELQEARGIYFQSLPPVQTLKYLEVIERYGDLSDVFYLRDLLAKTEDAAIRDKLQSLLAAAYSYEPRYL